MSLLELMYECEMGVQREEERGKRGLGGLVDTKSKDKIKRADGSYIYSPLLHTRLSLLYSITIFPEYPLL